MREELPIVQKVYELIQWYVPILNRLPRDFKYNLGDRIIARLYNLLEDLISAQFSKEKLALLQQINPSLTTLRYQTRLLLDFQLISIQRYEQIIKRIDEVGIDLGNWIKQQKTK
jgi:hypothetical protein